MTKLPKCAIIYTTKKERENKTMARVNKSTDERYPIIISDSWSDNKVYLTMEQAKELKKELGKIIKILEENT